MKVSHLAVMIALLNLAMVTISSVFTPASHKNEIKIMNKGEWDGCIACHFQSHFVDTNKSKSTEQFQINVSSYCSDQHSFSITTTDSDILYVLSSLFWLSSSLSWKAEAERASEQGFICICFLLLSGW